jgi:cytochrome c5
VSGPDRARRALALALMLAALALGAAPAAQRAPAPPARRAAYPDTFPAGEGKAIADRACLICHSAMLVTQQAKDSTGWEKTLGTMVAWGTPITPAERDTLRAYFVARLGPRPPASAK